MLCEMCGADSINLSSMKISGSVLRLCISCSSHGTKPTERESLGHRAYVAQTLQQRDMKRRYSDLQDSEEVLVANYGTLVRKAREKLGLDHATLASKISEKKSIITSVESQNIHPNEKLVKRLENFLGVKLMEKIDFSSGREKKKSSESLTMGDLLKKALDEK